MLRKIHKKKKNNNRTFHEYSISYKTSNKNFNSLKRRKLVC